eukprot:TRINITY_DN5651_c0_g1_i1.p1 TRINITY_DN5651_c0_g1~~TRINITY_DN5651_c0_g1_i1.p1  ORF type:complete len:1307 (+),score=320.74 TRINITY_DN5651_c0_g1_i1:241-4161(+)
MLRAKDHWNAARSSFLSPDLNKLDATTLHREPRDSIVKFADTQPPAPVGRLVPLDDKKPIKSRTKSEKAMDEKARQSNLKRRTNVATKIIVDLDATNMPELRAEWTAAVSVNLVEFVRIMMKYLPHNHTIDDEEFVGSLCQLFNEMDLNGDGDIQWEEFTSYIVDSTMSDELYAVNTDRMRQFRLSPLVDAAKHESPIENLMYFNGLDKIVCCEQKKKVKIYNPYDGVMIKSFEAHGGAVLAAEYIAESGMLLTSGSDLILSVWDTNNNYTRKGSIATDFPLTSMFYAPMFRMLFTGTTAGTIHVWPVREGMVQENDTARVMMQTGHTDVVTSFCSIEHLDTLVSSSLDGTIRMWEGAAFTPGKLLKGHTKGVLSVAYSDRFHMLLSAGFEHDVYIWNPFVGSLVNKLVGHQAPLIAVRIIADTPQCVTADMDSIFKVWDLRRFSCLQTFQAEVPFELNCFCVCALPCMVIAGGQDQRVHFFDTELLADPTASDENMVISACFNAVHRTFVTAAGHGVKIWNARTGELIKRFANLMPSDVTAFCLDGSGRKMCLADHEGNLKVCNSITGGVLSTLPKHDGEIMDVQFDDEGDRVVSCGWDHKIHIYDISGTECQLLKVIKGHQGDVTCVDLSRRIQLLASGSGDGTVRVWDAVNGQQMFMAAMKPREINSLQFLDPYPCLAAADSMGYVTLFTLPPSMFGYQRLIAWQNFHHGSFAIPVLCMEFDSEECCLYTGDERGEIKVWDLRFVFANAHLRPEKMPHADRTDMLEERLIKQRNLFHAPTAAGYEPHVGIEDVQIILKFKAHDDSITSLQIVKKPHIIVTSGADRMVRVWNRRGLHLGSLRALPTHLITWHFDDDEENAEKLRRVVLDVQHQCKLFENIPFDPIKERPEDIQQFLQPRETINTDTAIQQIINTQAKARIKNAKVEEERRATAKSSKATSIASAQPTATPGQQQRRPTPTIDVISVDAMESDFGQQTPFERSGYGRQLEDEPLVADTPSGDGFVSGDWSEMLDSHAADEDDGFLKREDGPANALGALGYHGGVSASQVRSGDKTTNRPRPVAKTSAAVSPSPMPVMMLFDQHRQSINSIAVHLRHEQPQTPEPDKSAQEAEEEAKAQEAAEAEAAAAARAAQQAAMLLSPEPSQQFPPRRRPTIFTQPAARRRQTLAKVSPIRHGSPVKSPVASDANVVIGDVPVVDSTTIMLDSSLRAATEKQYEERNKARIDDLYSRVLSPFWKSKRYDRVKSKLLTPSRYQRMTADERSGAAIRAASPSHPLSKSQVESLKRLKSAFGRADSPLGLDFLNA